MYPQAVGVRMGTCPYPERDSYSYSSIAAALHAESEDRAAEAHVPMVPTRCPLRAPMRWHACGA